VISTSSALTSFSETSSTAPAATASGGDAPIRRRNRTFIAIRPAELGTVRLMNLIAAWSTTQGRSGSGVGTEPRTEIPPPIMVSCDALVPRRVAAAGPSVEARRLL
jgi:hypothetical protein